MYHRKQVAEMIGIPARRIQFYTDQMMLPAVEKSTGRGRERDYSRDDVFRLAVIKEMSEIGLSLNKIKIFLENDDECFNKFSEPKAISYDRFRSASDVCFIYERSLGRDNFVTSSVSDYPMVDGANVAGEKILSRLIINLSAIFARIDWV